MRLMKPPMFCEGSRAAFGHGWHNQYYLHGNEGSSSDETIQDTIYPGNLTLISCIREICDGIQQLHLTNLPGWSFSNRRNEGFRCLQQNSLPRKEKNHEIPDKSRISDRRPAAAVSAGSQLRRSSGNHLGSSATAAEQPTSPPAAEKPTEPPAAEQPRLQLKPQRSYCTSRGEVSAVRWFVYAHPTTFPYLNPANRYNDSVVMSNCYETFTFVQPPGSATSSCHPSWQPSGLPTRTPPSWTFKIREGVKFTDGEPLDAAAVKWCD